MTTVRLWHLAALAGPVVILGAAMMSQYVGGLHPCVMCIWQRWPHAIAIALALITLLIGARLASLWALRLSALSLIVGAGIGFFHVGVEQDWWEGPSTCSGGPVGEISTEDLINQIMNAPLVRCDEIAWSLMGISMAGWNAIASLILATIALKAASLYASSSASQ